MSYETANLATFSATDFSTNCTANKKTHYTTFEATIFVSIYSTNYTAYE